ncbi:MAG: GntR family transcriptional regulator [Treponema sp.]|jgi:DNA-binding GntR family transcriptional regulator|nr:GntR family transcriptional regulator [Treponema sp.]
MGITVKSSAIQFNHRAPLYEQVKQSILHEIMSQTYTYGERLPSESELAEKYGVSRITVRRTIAELVERGYLSAQQGRGTFVKYKGYSQELLAFNHFSDGNIHHVKRKILSKEYIGADEPLSKALDVPLGTRMVKLHRLFCDTNKPYSLDTAYFLDELYPGIFDLIQDGVSTLKLLNDTYHMKFYKAYKILGVIGSGDEEAALLDCVPGEPLFTVDKTYYDQLDRPVHYSHYLLLGSRCKYTLTVTQDEGDTKVLFHDP